MLGNEIKLIISDFDGTLVDTFYANFKAYQKAFSKNGLILTEDEYKNAFGLRYDDFMKRKGIFEANTKAKIREMKSKFYPDFFSYLKKNDVLIKFIENAKKTGIKTALASTATKKNLMNVIDYLNINNIFDVILTGENTTKGKPDPEIYEKTLEICNCKCTQSLVFEDSEIGCKAAASAGIPYIKIGDNWYAN